MMMIALKFAFMFALTVRMMASVATHDRPEFRATYWREIKELGVPQVFEGKWDRHNCLPDVAFWLAYVVVVLLAEFWT